MTQIELVPAPGSPTGENISTAGIPKTVNFTGVWPAGGVAATISGHAYFLRGTWGGEINFYVTIASVEHAVVSSGGVVFDTAFPQFSANVPAGTITSYRFEVIINTSTFADNVEVWAYAETAAVSPTFCQYGTQLAQPGTFIYYLTPGLIDAILTTTGELWAAPFVTALWFTKVNAQTLCSIGPPTAPILTIDDFVGETPLSSFPDFLSKLEAWFMVRAWNYFCMCTPAPLGSPAPTPFPAPTQPAPTGVPLPLAFTCDNSDLCSILNQIGQAIAGLQINLTAVRSQVDLIQRQHVPFAYVPGTLHSGLSGSGTITVSGLLGLSVEITSEPGYFTSDMAPVASTWRFGTLSWGTVDGWERRAVVTHNPHLFLDIGADITEVAYLFETGVVANIQELRREP